MFSPTVLTVNHYEKQPRNLVCLWVVFGGEFIFDKHCIMKKKKSTAHRTAMDVVRHGFVKRL